MSSIEIATGSGASESEAHKLITNPSANCIGVFFLTSCAFATACAGSSRTMSGVSFGVFSLQDTSSVVANRNMRLYRREFERIILFEMGRVATFVTTKEKKKNGFVKFEWDGRNLTR